MSQANELLNGLTEDEIATYAMNPEGEEHIVIDEYRTVTVPESLKRIGVQFDNNIETVTFDCPRYWDGHDLSEMVVYINYMRPDGELGSFIAQHVEIDEADENIMHFDWTFTNHATAANGNLQFLVCIRNVDEEGYEEEHWNSELNSDLYISKGLEGAETLVDTDPDILTQTLILYRAVTTRAAVYVGSGEMPDGYNVQIDPNGTDVSEPSTGEGKPGATFYPVISEDGVLSWYNDQGIDENPDPIKIVGDDGDDGVTFTPRVTSDGYLEWSNNGGLTNPSRVKVKGDDYILTAADKEEIATAVKNAITTETWKFTLDTGSVATKEVYVK